MNKKINELVEENKFLKSLVKFYLAEIELIDVSVNLKNVDVSINIDTDIHLE